LIALVEHTHNPILYAISEMESLIWGGITCYIGVTS